ncbi:hypothetical protein NLU13_7413 [Sarocladium strictum]|uniref:Uncharacterized protein n=1 Tax=Sarocladium strictum TaxID=5046 RepID=A0AA39L5S9_SARSR|nr:hypothetical protein NLU13_7413 [Sarocladium strictum]
MLSFAPTPIFGAVASSPAPWNNRPAVSSPLSSSPIRASSPLSPLDKNTLFQRQTQSSPLQPPKFKFASRPSRPNPLVRKREEAQEARRTNFLQSVRRKAEDKAWQRRDIEGHFLKTSWLADRDQLARDAPTLTDADLEDAMAYGNEQLPREMDDELMEYGPPDDDLEAMLASYEQDASPSQRPKSPSFSDDDEYEDVFADFMSHEEPHHFRSISQPDPSDAMQLSQDMTF